MAPSKALANPTYTPMSHPPSGFKTFESFYPFYLGEHSQRRNRLLHVIGTTINIAIQTRVLLSLIPLLLRYVDPSTVTSQKNAKLIKDFTDKLRLSLGDLGKWLLAGTIQVYAFAWFGHFYVEKNRPATFKYPLFSARGDYRLWWEVMTLQRRL